jgi:hypothetical protein
MDSVFSVSESYACPSAELMTALEPAGVAWIIRAHSQACPSLSLYPQPEPAALPPSGFSDTKPAGRLSLPSTPSLALEASGPNLARGFF